ncbi:MAG: transporter [Candidatus Omnitrophota bacterium]
MRKKIFQLVIPLFIPAICQTSALAVNFYDGVRAPKGHYILTYSSYYTADKTTNVDGVVNNNDYDYRKNEEMIRYCYYSPNLLLTAFIPSGHVHSGLYRMSSGGIGDINLGAGYFLPVKQADILPALFVKLRNGDYESGKTVNYGTNQYDIKPTVFLYKALGKFSIDGAAKYYFRTQNRATRISPGNELYLQCLLGIQLNKMFKAGPSFNWMGSSSQKNNGTKVSGSKRGSFSIGGDILMRLPAVNITFTYLRDIESKNTTRGDFFQIKTSSKF